VALRRRGVPLYGLTNWSAETFPRVQPRFPFLGWFKGIVVSGAEKMVKPDPRIFATLMSRYGIAPGAAVYIDDSACNAEAAGKAGMTGIHFTGPDALRAALEGHGLL